MDVDVAIVEAPVNIMPLIDDTDFKTREVAIVYDSAGMDLVWNFVTTAGAMSTTAVTPTTAGDYDWAEQGTDEGMYSIEIPASGGASINNDTEGFGWFTGLADGVLPWRGPVIGFRAVGLNNVLIDLAYSATRGLAGTALPDAVADAAGGLVISDDGGWDADELYDAIITDAAGANIAIDIIALKAETVLILADTDDIGVAGAGLSAIPWNASWDAEVQSEVNDALIAINLDHLCLTATAAADMTAEVADNTILSRMLSNGNTSAFVPSTDGLQIIRDAITTAQDDLDTITGASGVVIADGLLTAAKFGADFLTSAKIADSAFLAVNFGADFLTAAKIADDAFAAEHFATNSLTADALAADFVDEIVDEEVDNDGTAISLRGAMKLILSVLTAKASGGGTTTAVFRDINDSKNRISATVDANGNRTAVGTRDAT